MREECPVQEGLRAAVPGATASAPFSQPGHISQSVPGGRRCPDPARLAFTAHQRWLVHFWSVDKQTQPQEGRRYGLPVWEMVGETLSVLLLLPAQGLLSSGPAQELGVSADRAASASASAATPEGSTAFLWSASGAHPWPLIPYFHWPTHAGSCEPLCECHSALGHA